MKHSIVKMFYKQTWDLLKEFIIKKGKELKKL